MTTRMRMLSVHHRQLRELLQDKSREQACFLLCSTAQGDDETILLVNEVVPLSAEDLGVHRFDQLSVSPAAMLRIARMAQRTKRAVCMVHTHPMSAGSVAFSLADDIGNERTFEFFHRMAPNLPHSCLVWDGDLTCCAGRVYYSAHEWKPISTVSVMNDANLRVFRDSIPTPDGGDVGEEYDRQARLLGKAGQRLLSAQRLSVIGAGGIGSIAAPALGHSGVRQFTLIDDDIEKKENLPRNLGATPTDVQARRLKVDVVARYLKECFPNAVIRPFPTVVEDPAILRQLVSSGCIVCSTDDTTSRAFLNQLCNQYYVPVLDLGVQFAADPRTGELVKEIGKVNLVLPGQACMLCTQHINPKVLHDEGLTPEQRVAHGKYVEGVDEHEPSMMVFNMDVVARGLQLFTFWVTGIAHVDLLTYERVHFLGVGAARGVRRVTKGRMADCPYCGAQSCVLGVGDRESMWVRARPRKAA